MRHYYILPRSSDHGDKREAVTAQDINHLRKRLISDGYLNATGECWVYPNEKDPAIGLLTMKRYPNWVVYHWITTKTVHEVNPQTGKLRRR
jgi:hypothetical protein